MTYTFQISLVWVVVLHLVLHGNQVKFCKLDIFLNITSKLFLEHKLELFL
jgi:hypothetical protein